VTRSFNSTNFHFQYPGTMAAAESPEVIEILDTDSDSEPCGLQSAGSATPTMVDSAAAAVLAAPVALAAASGSLERGEIGHSVHVRAPRGGGAPFLGVRWGWGVMVSVVQALTVAAASCNPMVQPDGERTASSSSEQCRIAWISGT
jgi:hypothetical protein